MLEQMSVTQLLGIMISLYFIAASVGILLDPRSINRLLPNLAENPMLCFLTGIVVFALGGTIVAIHNIWSDWLSGFVSLVGWVALLEGLTFIVLREKLAAWFAELRFSDNFFRGFAGATAIVGLIILYFSVSGN